MCIELYINSPGGAMSAGFDLIDFIRQHYIPINTIGTGTVASMGVSLLLGGNKKYITPNTHILVHQLRAGIQGKRNDMIDYWKHIENIHKQTVAFIAANTKLNKSEVENMLKNETWLTAEEAVKHGFADEIKG
jgi:ATP-dependent Clp protease protease subunit